jgi:hypothetical protein
VWGRESDSVFEDGGVMARIYEKMFECSACTSVFIIAIYRRPESMPCLHEPLHCPFCMSGGNSLIRIHKSLPDKGKKALSAHSGGGE